MVNSIIGRVESFSTDGRVGLQQCALEAHNLLCAHPTVLSESQSRNEPCLKWRRCEVPIAGEQSMMVNVVYKYFLLQRYDYNIL